MKSLFLAALVCMSMHARAQDVDPRLFDARVTPGALIGLDTSWVLPHLSLSAGLVGSVVNDELVGDDPLDPDAPRGPLRLRLVSTLGVALGIADALELQVALPLHTTEEVTGGERAAAFGVGDLRVAVRWRALGPRVAGEGGLGLALQLGAGLPTGGGAPFATDGGLVLDPRLILDWRSAGGIGVVVEAGYRVRPTTVFENLAVGDEVRYGAGLEVPLGALGVSAPLALLGEIEGAVGLAEATVDPDAPATGRKLPLEARLGLRLFGASWALTGAAGVGLTDGYGTPDYRVVVGFTWGRSPLPAPPAREAIVQAPADPAHAPPPEFPPVAGFAGTGGGIPGGAGGAAPLDPAAVAALAAAVAADPDADGDGVPLPADACPRAREDLDGRDDGDGCPDPDDDQDGVPDVNDKCLDQAEVPNGVADDDGCPDEGQAGVVATGGRIELRDTIAFNSGSDVLAPTAMPVLAQIAAVLKANPQVKRVRIEGHTDDQGDKEMNVDLSERRAARVRSVLVKLGVQPERLLPRGFGSTRPIAPNTSDKGRKLNRRVVLEVIDPPPEGGPRIEVPEESK